MDYIEDAAGHERHLMHSLFFIGQSVISPSHIGKHGNKHDKCQLSRSIDVQVLQCKIKRNAYNWTALFILGLNRRKKSVGNFEAIAVESRKDKADGTFKVIVK